MTSAHPVAVQHPTMLGRLSATDAETLLHRIGRTPVRPILLKIGGIPRKVYLKLEGANPGGSIKDRTALSLIEMLERTDQLSTCPTVVESSSGNLGVALALIARARGYRLHAVVDPRISAENLTKLQDLGAEIDMVASPHPAGGYLRARLDRVQAVLAATPGSVWPNQYENPANPQVHFRTTAPEIHRQLDGRVDAVFVAVSTCGTLCGIGAYFRRVSPRTRVIAVDALGSVAVGGPPGFRLLVGIGSDRRSSYAVDQLHDDQVLVDDRSAFAFCRALHNATGIKVGGSSGAVLHACSQYLAQHPQLARVVCICADTGDNYQATVYDDAWLRRHELSLSLSLLYPVEDISVA